MSTISTFEDTASRGFAIDERRDREHVFRVAARHSRRVRFLRKAIPVVIASILGATVLFAWIDPLKVLVKLPSDAGRLVISGSKITMESPKLTGYTHDRRWYELTAQAAAQDVTKPDFIELRRVRAKIEAQDKSMMFLSAIDGLFNREGNILTLNRDIVLRSSSGYEMHLDEAVVDTGKGEVMSNKPVKVITDQGTLTADGLEVFQSGDVINFVGHVVMNLNGRDENGAPVQDAPTTDTPPKEKP